MASGGKGGGASLRERIVRRAALEFKDGMYGMYMYMNTDDYNRCTCTLIILVSCFSDS